MKKILIAGGGTGGHVFPGIAIAQELQRVYSNIQVEFVGTKNGAESKLVPTYHFKLNEIEVAGFNRSNWKENLTFPIKLGKGIYQSKKLLDAFQPDAVIATGGYVSGPVTQLAQWKKIKTYVQEQNAVPGFTTKKLARKANKIFLTYDYSKQFFEQGIQANILVLGNPVRQSLSEGNKNEAATFFQLEKNRSTILVIGGSLGARSINQSVYDQLENWVNLGHQVIWQTGKTDKEFPELKENISKYVYRQPFINEMNLAYSLADLIVSRAGATTLAEITFCGKPSILVPFPFAADDHQSKNAEAMKSAGASVIIKDDQLKQRLGNIVNQMMLDKNLLDNMSLAARKLAKPNAAKEIVENILKDLND